MNKEWRFVFQYSRGSVDSYLRCWETYDKEEGWEVEYEEIPSRDTWFKMFDSFAKNHVMVHLVGYNGHTRWIFYPATGRHEWES